MRTKHLDNIAHICGDYYQAGWEIHGEVGEDDPELAAFTAEVFDPAQRAFDVALIHDRLLGNIMSPSIPKELYMR